MCAISRHPIAKWAVLLALVINCQLVGTAVAGDDSAEIEISDSFVAMSDDIELATTVYRPKQGGPFPVVVSRTPYNKDGLKNDALRFCRNGYAFVAQDLRGRFKSKGHHAVIFHNDGWSTPHDGHDCLAWIARQSWCNGKIGSTGGSALGITQNMAAPGAPPALAAQFVVVAFSDMYRQGAYQGGAFRTGLLENWLKATGMTDVNLMTFVAHPRYDKFWEELNAEPQAERVNAPGVFFGGWYDIFLQGTINSFTTIQSRGGPAAKGRCRLVIAPIGHGSMTELKYPASAGKLPRCADNLAWFDAMLKGKDNGIAAEKPVHYYVMGDPTDATAPGNEWRAADTWPPPATETPYYLHASGRLSTERPAEGGSRSYKYDPAQPVPTIGGAELGANIGPRDQRSVESRPDVLLFTSDVLEAPLEVTGRITARLSVSSDCPDTDFAVKLTDVYPDGRSMLVTDGILRTRFRESFEQEKYLEPGEVIEIPVDLWSTSLVFNKGHRIRIAVSSSNAPRFDPNPNTGHAFRANQEQRVATNTVYFSDVHPSQIVLPVHRALAAREPVADKPATREPVTGKSAPAATREGQRVFSAGHSFHVFVPGILADMANKAGITDHKQVGLSAIGGSRVIQHWDVADDKFKAKEALRSGNVDVLTLSPIHLPDSGIENFARLALEHNPGIRILVQENWLPFDLYDTTFTQRPATVDYNAPTGDELRKLHAPYFKAIDEHVEELNKKLETTALRVAPVGQAVIALREKIIAGEAPGLKVQQELFGDAIGHATPPLQALVSYCYFAQVYQRSPVGLPLPAVLANAKNPNWDDKLNKLLQELAWNSVTQHPLSGVKAPAAAQTGLVPPDSPFPAHRIVGNVYYVGSKALASYLIATPEGHILINSSFEETVPLIRASVESLGYKMSDIKILLASHAHSDHVAGHALAQELTNAKVYVMQGDDRVIASGGEGQYLYTDSRWKPCPVDVILHDGDEVKLGGQTLTARSTPGHTRGCTTWTWRVADGDKKYDVVVIGSPNVNPGYRLVDNKDYPEIADDFAKTFKVLKALPCDIFLGAHGDYYGMLAKFERIKSSSQSPFIDPAGYRDYVEFKEKAFRKTLEEQMANK